MNRLGLWGPEAPFSDFANFQQFIDKAGVNAMEIIALDLKSQGFFLARQLSFTGATFRIHEVMIDMSSTSIYEYAIDTWNKIRTYMQNLEEVALEKSPERMNAYWAAHQRYFKNLAMVLKVQEAVQLTNSAVLDGKAVVLSVGDSLPSDASLRIYNDSFSVTIYKFLRKKNSYLINCFNFSLK
jgi:hypothetical protein